MQPFSRPITGASHTIQKEGETIISPAGIHFDMAEKPTSGELLGIPYNFERPELKRLLSSYWQPGEGMLVKKPFGIGYSLNLANWRSWIVLALVGALVYQEQSSKSKDDESDEDDEEPVEVIVD